MAKNIKDPELYKISAKNWIDPREFARSKGVAKSDSPSKRVATPKIGGYEKPTASISPYNAGLKLSPAQQAELEKSLRNRKMLENVQQGLGAAEALGIYPHPVTEGIGLGAGLLNAGLSSYLAGQDYSSGNYGGMAANLVGAGLSGAGAAAFAPKKVTDVVNTAAKSKNLKELGAYTLQGIPPEKSLGRLGKADLKAMRQVQNVKREADLELDKVLQNAIDQDIPDVHFKKAFGYDKEEAAQLIKTRAADREALARLQAEQRAESARQLAEMQASGQLETQAIEDIDVNDIDWSQFDESNDSMYDYDTYVPPSSDLDIDGAANQYVDANQLASPPDTIYTDISTVDFRNMVPDGFEQDASGIYRNQYGETVAEENARLDQQYADYIADEYGYGSPGVVSQLAGGQLRNAKNQLGEVIQEAGDQFRDVINTAKKSPKLQEKLTNLLQEYPTFLNDSDVKLTNKSLFLSKEKSLKNVAGKIQNTIQNQDKIIPGTVFTGSLNTSHNSYLPQLKQVFKSGEGTPTFLGYKPMNTYGYLSEGSSYTPEEIAAYLNTEIDDQVRRNIVPNNIQRPYVKKDKILLPQYGITKKKSGGNISPEKAKEMLHNPPHGKPLTEKQRKYFGYLSNLEDGGELNYNDYTVSASPDFQGDGYFNEGRNYSPAWGGQFAMGGVLPGSVGFMYARTNDPAPSNGPYAKKTKPSAENGTEMKYYQDGLDFKPKTISRDGSQLVKLDQLTNFTNYNTKQPGGWLDKYEG